MDIVEWRLFMVILLQNKRREGQTDNLWMVQNICLIKRYHSCRPSGIREAGPFRNTYSLHEGSSSKTIQSIGNVYVLPDTSARIYPDLHSLLPTPQHQTLILLQLKWTYLLLVSIIHFGQIRWAVRVRQCTLGKTGGRSCISQSTWKSVEGRLGEQGKGKGRDYTWVRRKYGCDHERVLSVRMAYCLYSRLYWSMVSRYQPVRMPRAVE